MLKKLIALIALVVLGISLSACGSSTNDTQLKQATLAAAEEPTSLVGIWIVTERDAATQMVATVKNEIITITLVTDDTTYLYWRGTMPGATNAHDGQVFVSKADRKVLDSAILGSSENTKKFLYEDGHISYKISMMGATTTVTLKPYEKKS